MSVLARPFPFAPTARRVWRVFTRPHVILGVVLLALMLYFVLMPLLVMIQTTFTWQPEDMRLADDVKPGEFTLFHWVRIFSSRISQSMLYDPLINTLYTSVGISFFALAIGTLLAWLVVRTDLPGRKLISGVAIIPYMLPSWTISLAWIVVFKNERIGGSIGFLQVLTGMQPPDWLSYGPVPIIITLSLHYYAFSFLFCCFFWM